MKELLLKDETARELYNEHASKLPIFDFHCHLDAKEIWENKRFCNIGELWLKADHYKWRLMRQNGIDERLITGAAPYSEKFAAFVQALERAMGSPLQAWCAMELKKYFGITAPLSSITASSIFKSSAATLAKEGMDARGLIEMSNVHTLITTDDPTSSLTYHKRLKKSSFGVQVLPGFRPDNAFNTQNGFSDYIGKLSRAAAMPIKELDDLKAALASCIDYFCENGCVTADHSFYKLPFNIKGNAAAAFKKALTNKALSADEQEAYAAELLIFLAQEYKKRGMVMQLHLGCVRNNNSRLFSALGTDIGGDGAARTDNISRLYSLLNHLNELGALPKTVIYSLDPADNALIDILSGVFNINGVKGAVQHGSAWWFNDHYFGIREQLKGLMSNGILGNFIGMLTDSRSFTSYVRHDYFRRILCSLVSELLQAGVIQTTPDAAGRLIEDICFNNAKNYFNTDKEAL